MIKVENLSREFTYSKKKEGLKGSLSNFFKREKLIKKAVDGISFEVDDGEIIGFLGPNGAGKTTTLKMLSGILYPTSGNALVNNFIPWERKKEFKQMISILLGNKSQLWPDLPALDSFMINKKIYEIDDASYKKRVSQLSEMFQVDQLLHVQTRRLSLGERMKLEIIASLLHDPKIVFFDEPTIGLDLISQKSMREFIRAYNEQYNVTIIITSHNTADIEALCKRIVVINHGNLIYDGDVSMIDEHLNQYKVIKIESETLIDFDSLRLIEGVDEIDRINEYSCSLRVDRNCVNETVIKILMKKNISDINISEYPLEKQIETIFTK